MPPRKSAMGRAAPANTQSTRGTASGTPAGVDLTTSAASSEPKLPHDRDEGVGMTGGAQSTRIQQAANDLKRGMQDTSRAPEADRAYDKLKK